MLYYNLLRVGGATLKDTVKVTEKFVSKYGSETYEALPPFLRLLLSADGTVTDMLEAWYLQEVTVERLPSADEHVRNAVLHVGNNQDGILYAVSTFDLKSLGPMAHKLISSELPIGRVIDELFGGTYRIIKEIDYTLETRTDFRAIKSYLGVAPYSSGRSTLSAKSRDQFIERTYTIYSSADDKPVVTINEIFNVERFK